MSFNTTNAEDFKTHLPYDEDMETTLQRLDVLEDALMVVKDVGNTIELQIFNDHLTLNAG